MALEAKVITVSSSVAAGTREDRSGPRLAELLGAAGFTVVGLWVAPDGVAPVATALRRACESFAGLVVTTGGTGFGPDDLTPEATAEVVERSAPGLAEAMRAAGPLGRLTRGAAGIVGPCIVCNVPGSPAGAAEAISAILDVLPHALTLAAGGRPH
jgi:molybdenum cofactor synthesis domain-containing protein